MNEKNVMNAVKAAALIAAAVVGTAFAQPQTQPQQPQSSSRTAGTFTDARDGKKYKTVTIGKQTWMARNLNYLPKPGNSWCYDNDTSNCGKYGRLYDFQTAMAVCPSGFHLPSREEWDTLVAAAGGDKTTAGKKLRARSGWSWNKDSNGTDDYGFSALPGGARNIMPMPGSGNHDLFGVFGGIGNYGNWWTRSRSTEADGDGVAYYRSMGFGDGRLYDNIHGLDNAFSVRCVAD